jgi:hypothetical protein
MTGGLGPAGPEDRARSAGVDVGCVSVNENGSVMVVVGARGVVASSYPS